MGSQEGTGLRELERFEHAMRIAQAVSTNPWAGIPGTAPEVLEMPESPDLPAPESNASGPSSPGESGLVLQIPDFCLVLLVGPAGSGKSSLAARHFRPTEILSSDRARAWITDDEAEQEATADAFALLHRMADLRLAWRRLTVVDATNLESAHRQQWLAIARAHHAETVALVLHFPLSLVRERNRARSRQVSQKVLDLHFGRFHAEFPALQGEGYSYIHILEDPHVVETLTLSRVPLPVDRRQDPGPFDLVGDVHACHGELVELLEKLGYKVAPDGLQAVPPTGRRALFLGDLVDRGPEVVQVLELVMGMVEAGHALCLPGNHDDRLMRALLGRPVQTLHGLEATLEQLNAQGSSFRERVLCFFKGLPSHLVLDSGKLVAAHAGLRADLQNRDSKRVRAFCLYGDPTGRLDSEGLPERRDWVREYRGRATVVYGHTPVATAAWRNNTMNLDTGCVFGGRLSALRWPEKELVSVPARQAWCESPRSVWDLEREEPEGGWFGL